MNKFWTERHPNKRGTSSWIRTLATTLAVLALVVGVGATPASADPSLSISVDSFTRDDADGRAHYVITAAGVGISCGNCGIKLELQDSNGVWSDFNSNGYFGSSVVFDSYIGWSDTTFVAARAYLFNASYTAVSSAEPITDTQRGTSISLSIDEVTRDSEDARVAWATSIDVSALRNSDCTAGPCYLQLVADYEGIGEVLLYSGGVTNRYASSFEWSGQLGYWNRMIRMQARWGNVASPWAAVTDAPREPSITLTVGAFERDQTDGRVWWETTVELSHADSSSCPWSTCAATLIAQDADGNEYTMDSHGVPSTYHGIQSWSGFFGYWKTIERLQVRYQGLSSDWVDVDDVSREPGIGFVVNTFTRNTTTGFLDYELELHTSALAVSMCGQLGGCGVKLFAVDSNGVDHQLSGGWLTNWYTQTFDLDSSYSGNETIVNLRAEYGSFSSEWLARSESIEGGHDLDQAAEMLLAYAGGAGLGNVVCTQIFQVGTHVNGTSLSDQDMLCRSALATMPAKQAIMSVLKSEGGSYLIRTVVRLGLSRAETGYTSDTTLPSNCSWVGLEVSCVTGGMPTTIYPDDAPPPLDEVYEDNLVGQSLTNDPRRANVLGLDPSVSNEDLRRDVIRTCVAQIEKLDSGTGLTEGSLAGLVADDCGRMNLFVVGHDYAQATAHDIAAIQANPVWMKLTYQSESEKSEPRRSWAFDEPCLSTMDLGDDCDEFPYFSTEEGWPQERNPSIRAIPLSQNRGQGAVYGRFSTFCKFATYPRHSLEREFIVVETRLIKTFGVCGTRVAP